MKEQEVKIPITKEHKSLLHYLAHFVDEEHKVDGFPVRFAVTKTDDEFYHCEIGTLISTPAFDENKIESIFCFRQRNVENTEDFNAVLLVPTGIGSDLGGHAGDAGPVARLMATVCDNFITHPNVVNASDINEMTENTLYVEGSVLARLLMGTIGLQKVRNNRILMIIDDHEKEVFVSAAVNSVNAARATYGLDSPEVVKLNPPIIMTAAYSSSGMAVGTIDGIDNLFRLLDKKKDEFDAVALSSVIKVPYEYHMDYFTNEGSMLNPWGGVEAMLTHAISHLYNMPSAHSPMFETEQIANMDPGVVDSRMAAEAVSMTFLQSILKGLKCSPKIITSAETMKSHNVLTAEDVSCVVIPDKCIGLPTLAALEQGIPVIAVRDNTNVMDNDLSILPWGHNQLHYVDNYLEATGVMAAIKAGIPTEAVLRPLRSTKVNTERFEEVVKEKEVNYNPQLKVKA